MATQQAIEINYQEAKRQAEKINGAAVRIDRIVNRLGNIQIELQRSWNGDAASLYLQKQDVTKRNLSEMGRVLKILASTIETTAENYRKTELAAIETIQYSSGSGMGGQFSAGGGGGGGQGGGGSR